MKLNVSHFAKKSLHKFAGGLRNKMRNVHILPLASPIGMREPHHGR